MFFGRDAHLGLLTAAVMGAQHALAMTAGLITPPLLIGFLANDASIQACESLALPPCCCVYLCMCMGRRKVNFALLKISTCVAGC